MKKLNEFQLKSLSNLCFDLGKAWFIAGIIAPVGAYSVPLINKISLLLIGLIACWLLIRFGLFFGEEIKNV